MASRLQFSFAAVLLLILIVGVGRAVSPVVNAYTSVRGLSNAALAVDGTYYGLDIKISGDSAACLSNLGTFANPWLTDALSDEDKFAAAHVLLTRINLKEPATSNSHWNHMEVDLGAAGSTDFHSEQIPELIEYWRLVLGE